ncbi:MAG: thiolase family protein [Peptococcaceae bacterium]|jgi:acetyl-CoA C-acetyltransferase|nr:thiolase family protein [Peptococcaceae bacterium]
MERVVLTSFARTPFSSQNGKEYQEMSLPNLALIPMKAAMERSHLGKSDVDGVIAGVMDQHGEGGNLARELALRSGLAVETGLGYTLNRICGSGFTTVTNSMMELWTGQGNVYVAVGAEMNSHRLISLPLSFAWTGIPRGGIMLGGRVSEDGGTVTEMYGDTSPMGTVEKAAKLYGVTREESDIFAYDSQMKAKRAQDDGRLAAEIVPIDVPQTDKKGKVTMVTYDKDLHLKPFTKLEVLANLPTVYKKDGVITAGNASGSVDGAAVVVLMTESEAKRRDVPAVAYLNDFAFAGVDPSLMGTGPAPAIQKLLKKTNLTLDDIDVIEINEAFAAQVLSVMKMLDQSLESNFYKKLNLNGGGVSIGHPEGGTGVRLTMTVAEELRRSGKKLGICSACIGGGMGVAILLENAQI